MNGKLSELPLAELLHEISLKGLSGTLRLQHEGVKAAVYVDAGEIIYAASNLRELRLAEYLRKQGLVSEQQLSTLGNRSDTSLASALSANGLIDYATVEALFSGQVGDILRMTLLWTNGTWEFDDRSLLGDSVRVKLDRLGLLMEAARRMPLDFVASRFPAADETISPVTGLPDFNALLPAEGFVLSRVDGPINLSELIAVSGMGEPEAIRTVYGLVLGGFVERERPWNALQVKRVRLPADDVRPDLAQRAQGAEPLNLDQSSAQSQEVDLEGFLARLDGASNHYEVLNISSTAAPQHIKNSYYALARLYHPDKFHLQTTSAQHARIESAFARITQAYETLTDSRRRSGYDAKLAALEKSRKFAQSAPKKVSTEAELGVADGGHATFARNESDRAENNFTDGFAALQQGQTKQAATKLGAAARAVPQEARYRAYYGRALALSEETRRLAEAEIQAAVKLDPNNASYRIMLAELFYGLGFFRRAEGELERAMAIDANNPDARKLLSKLEATRTTR